MGLWPKQTDVWREIARRGLSHEKIVREGNQILAHLDSSPRDAEVVALRPWALFDTGKVPEAFERAYEVFKGINARLQSEEMVHVTRAEIAERFSLPIDGPILHQIIWVLYSTFGGMWSKTGTDSDWAQDFGVGILRNPVSSLEEQFLQRPRSWRPLSGANEPTDVIGVVTNGLAESRWVSKRWDLFLSHASEDKDFAEQLVGALKKARLKVWYDSHEMKLGDSLARKIDEGLAKSRYGIVILSRHFLRKKHWPQKELDGLVDKEVDGRKVILPIWHGLTQSELRRYSPVLAGRHAAKSADGLAKVVGAILEVVRPRASPPTKVEPPTSPKRPTDRLRGEQGKGHYLPVTLSLAIDGESFEVTVADSYRVEISRAAGPPGSGRWHGRLLGDHVFDSSWSRNAEIYSALERAISAELDRHGR